MRISSRKHVMRGALLAVWVGVAGGTALAADPPAKGQGPGPAIQEMASAARAFLAALDKDQRAVASFPFEGDERENWHYVPLDRKGLAIKVMRPDQRALAFGLLASGMSQKGFVSATTIMSLEQILSEMENAPERRDPEKYYVSIFGQPKRNATWGWRVEGHHLSVNFTVVKGSEVAATPSFFGTNPGQVMEGPRKGLRVLGSAEDLGRRLAKALIEAGHRDALVFAAEAPGEILTREERAVKPLDAVGVEAAAMDKAQKNLLRRLVREYLFRHRHEFARADLAAIEAAGFDQVRFGWAGGLERGEPHYYRVQGPTFLLEYANTQNDANHAHAVWREFDGDFGRDLLAEHYREDHGKE